MSVLRASLAALLLILAVVAPARAASPIEEAQKAELDRVRARVADQVQLAAYDLVDELVYGWTQEPIFDKPTPVVLAGVSVPVGLGTGMQALVENHLTNVVLVNPSTRLQLVHCPACSQVVVRSGPEATVVTRGIDQPEVLQELGTRGGLHALFVDIEAEGAFLVLRARVTRLDGSLAIVWSRTLSTSTSTPSLLRDARDLKSAEEAREEYLDALRDRGNVNLIARVGVRSYARGFDPSAAPAPPFLWVELGAELAPTEAFDWSAAVVVGGSWIPQAYQGLLAEARVNRLLTGRTRSHTRPDLYLFVGGSVQTLWGNAVTPLLIQPSPTTPPRVIFGTLLVGLDLRLGNRVGFAAFFECYPSLRRSENVGTFINPIGIPFQSIGTEVELWF